MKVYDDGPGLVREGHEAVGEKGRGNSGGGGIGLTNTHASGSFTGKAIASTCTTGRKAALRRSS
jgi:hypothetical protein